MESLEQQVAEVDRVLETLKRRGLDPLAVLQAAAGEEPDATRSATAPDVRDLQ